jgi:SPP1 family holin
LANKEVKIKTESQEVFVPVEAPKVDAMMIVRTLVFLASLINAVAALFGKELNLHVNQDLTYQIISAALLVGSSLYAAWKNNNVTKAARIQAAAAKQVQIKK